MDPGLMVPVTPPRDYIEIESPRLPASTLQQDAVMRLDLMSLQKGLELKQRSRESTV